MKKIGTLNTAVMVESERRGGEGRGRRDGERPGMA